MTNANTSTTSKATAAMPPATVPTSMSMRLWGLDWSSVLPWTLDDITVDMGTADDALAFVGEHYTQIFGMPGAESRFLAQPMTTAKRRFFGEMDALLLRRQSRTIGLLLAHPTDWSTYYMRTIAILPEFRDRRLLTRLMELTYEPLRAAGVERIEGDCAPTNTPMMKMLAGQGFVVTSTASSERWGALVRSTKFLRSEAEQIFTAQFINFPPNRRAETNQHEERRRS